MRERPLLFAAGVCVYGIVLAVYIPWLCAALAAAALVPVGLKRKSRLPRWGWPALSLILCFALCNVKTAQRIVYDNWECAKTGSAEGRISKIVHGKKYCRLMIEQAQAVVWIPEAQAQDFFAGQYVVCRGETEAFEQATNPGQFDSMRYYRALGYAGQLWASQWQAREAATRTEQVCRALYRIRREAEKLLERNTPEDAGILQAILLGVKENLEEEQEDLYRAGGAAHLLSVSGLHVSILCMGLYRLLRRLHLPVPIVLVCAGTVCAGYVWLTGASVSAVRAAVMFEIWLGAILLGRTYDLFSAVSLAALFMLARHPLLLFESGFQLSFAAILLLASADGTKKASAGLRLYAGMAPVLAWHYGQVTLVSAFVNLLIVPLAPFLFVLGLGGLAAASLPGIPEGGFFRAAHGILKLYEWICRTVKTLPFGVLTTGRPACWQILLYLAVWNLPWAVKKVCARGIKERRDARTQPMERRARLAAAVGTVFLPLLLCRLPQRDLSVVMLDVGQGDCFLTHFENGQWMMTDGGSSDVEKVWKYRIKPYLTYMRITKLDCVLVTHGDADHCGGIVQMLQDGFPVRMLLLSGNTGESNTAKLIEAAEANGTEVRKVKAGDCWKIGTDMLHTAQITVLWPHADFLPEDINEASVVYRLEQGTFSALFTGDLPEKQERELLREGADVSAVVLKAAHHGSRGSCAEAFLDAVSPSCTLISSGKENQYGHPHAETLERLEAVGSLIRMTKEDGAVTVSVRNGTVWVQTFCKENARAR